MLQCLGLKFIEIGCYMPMSFFYTETRIFPKKCLVKSHDREMIKETSMFILIKVFFLVVR